MYDFTNFHLVSAKADFQQLIRDEWAGKAQNISGNLQEHGEFIFYIKEDNYRKMVLTSPTGTILQAGYLPLNAKDWKDAGKWRYANWYRVVNFNAVRGKNTYS